jgi:soluble lytic murein transglycosylase-like protein
LGSASLAAILSAAGISDRPQMTQVVRADPRTGKLVRSVIVTSKPVAPAAVLAAAVPSPAASAVPPVDFSAAGFNAAVARVAAEQSVPELLIHSVIKVESNYNPFAVSPKGAMGIMQLMPETARRFGVADVFDPLDNLQGGVKYLRYLLNLYHNDYTLTIAAYNAGEAAVERYGNVPPFPETRSYLVQVRRAIELSRKTQTAPAPVPQPAQPAESSAGEPRHIQETIGADGIVRYVTR